ncbi:MAG: septum formation protein Maf [Candidatus Eisenbacteria bacterium]|nr:septum formation protein Maf [Candidatus Eisenbacteria bacterium]
MVLASGSPRRRRILDGLELEFVVDVPDIHEPTVDGELPAEHVVRLARLKAREVAGRHVRGTIVAADTAVLLGEELLGKPEGRAEAELMLRSLSGRWHEVFTGVVVIRCSDGALVEGVERTRVMVRDLTEAEIRDYVAGGEPLDKAGAYGIQDCGSALVSKVSGCFYNVVGLPVTRLLELLKELAAIRE